MPSVWRFLLQYYAVTGNETALQQVRITLDCMALGGIYDQLGGGFARYSTDGDWFAPHFEKMLYDNGQLLTLYAEAYSLAKSKLYKHVVYQTIGFAQTGNCSAPKVAFTRRLMPTVKGVEGKFLYLHHAGIAEDFWP